MPRENVVPMIASVFDHEGNQVDEGAWHAVKATPEGGSVSMKTGLEVVWARDGWVQVGIDVPRGLILSVAKALESEPDTLASSFYVDVTRYEANKAIATIRRARNAAFGADE